MNIIDFAFHAFTAAILVGFTALFIQFLHFSIGSPSGEEFETGRIFSLWGRFVATGYAKHHKQEEKRIWAKYERIVAVMREKLDKDIQDFPTMQKELVAKFNTEIESLQNRVESWRRGTWYSALGACMTCFGTWVSMLLWLVFMLLGLNPVFWLLGVCASTMLANRI